MRQFELHPIAFKDGGEREFAAIGALLLDDRGFELEWDDPDVCADLDDSLNDLLEQPLYRIGPHPNPMFKATVRVELNFGSPEWLIELNRKLEGSNYRLRIKE